MTNWRVMLNHKLWDQTTFENNFRRLTETHRLAQSKGRARMVQCPKKGDTVCFVLKGHIVMRGLVDSEGFETGTYHQEHSCNQGGKRLHAENPEFCWIKIQEVGLNIPIRPTGQRTWMKFE